MTTARRALIASVAALIVLMVLVVITALLPSRAYAHDYRVQIKRWVDADTFDGVMDMGLGLGLDARFRLMCINAPESNTEAGRAMNALLATWEIESGTVVALKRDSFGRILAYLTPTGWDETLNKRLHDLGAPLYGRLSRADRELCMETLG